MKGDFTNAADFPERNGKKSGNLCLGQRIQKSGFSALMCDTTA